MIIIKQVLSQAAQLSGIISVDEQLDGTLGAMALIKLNEILAQLNLDQLFPYSKKIVSYTPASQKLSYTIGIANPVADIQEVRPAFINRILAYPGGSSTPFNVQQIALEDLLSRQLPTSSSTPSGFAVNPSFPLAEIHLDVKPTQGMSFLIVYNAELPQMTINSQLEAPLEYTDVLVTALARKLAVLQQMPEETISLVNTLYNEAITRVRTANSRNQVPTLDAMYGADFQSNIMCFNAITTGY
jgi:hypothetical protein